MSIVLSSRSPSGFHCRVRSASCNNGIQLSNLNYLMTFDGIIEYRDGIPLVEQGKMIGAIGCSGGASSQDEVVCKAGAAVMR